MLSQTAEYALRAVVTLAQDAASPRTAQQISSASQVPLDYLSKVLNSLARSGVVTSQRGRGGGFQTTNSASQLTVLQVVNAVDPLKRIETCPLGIKSHGTNLCPLHRKLDDALKSVEDAFSQTTIESLAGHAFCETESCHAVA